MTEALGSLVQTRRMDLVAYTDQTLLSNEETLTEKDDRRGTHRESFAYDKPMWEETIIL